MLRDLRTTFVQKADFCVLNVRLGTISLLSGYSLLHHMKKNSIREPRTISSHPAVGEKSSGWLPNVKLLSWTNRTFNPKAKLPTEDPLNNPDAGGERRGVLQGDMSIQYDNILPPKLLLEGSNGGTMGNKMAVCCHYITCGRDTHPVPLPLSCRRPPSSLVRTFDINRCVTHGGEGRGKERRWKVKTIKGPECVHSRTKRAATCAFEIM